MHATVTSCRLRSGWRAWLRSAHVVLCGILWSLQLSGIASAAPTPTPTPVSVDQREAIAVWPAVTLLKDDDGRLTLDDVMAAPGRFEVHQGTPSNLGRSATTVWLRIPLDVTGTQTLSRVFEIDYPPLNRIDVYLVQHGEVLSHNALGNELDYEMRPLPSRTHAAPLTLPPGRSELFVRVHTQSSLVLPMTLRTPECFSIQESLSQMLNGMLAGVALCMLAYSLIHGVSLRDRAFLAYAVMVAGNTVFFFSYYGVGQQYLWPHAPHLAQQISPLAVLVAIAGGCGFVRVALAVDEISRWGGHALRGVSALAIGSIAANLLGLIDYRAMQLMTSALGPLFTGAVLPVALMRAWRGERSATILVVGWVCYTVGAISLTLLLRGQFEPTVAARYLYPAAAILEMAVWMVVLGMRVQTVQRSADRTRIESETLRALAHTDALTGLPNRRGLQGHLAAALPQSQPRQLLAVFLLDLDGFKPVNDRHGHDVGDALLVAVGKRLQAELRGSDVVARLGGDEFVVLAQGLADEAAAHRLGQKMLSAFEAPFEAAGQHCKVGLTVGYALAPLDAASADELIKRADAAMYAGKAAGRGRVERSPATVDAA
jgi:diguanylate cyclase